MAPPNIEDTRKAAQKIQALTGPDIDKRQHQEVGDPLLAFFTILAKKMFPNDPENATVLRVRLMVAAYFLRGELEHTPIAPPDEQTALKAVKAVTMLAGPALEQRINNEIGDVVLAFFSAFSSQLMPEKEPQAVTSKVHLMTLAYLLRGDFAGKK